MDAVKGVGNGGSVNYRASMCPGHSGFQGKLSTWFNVTLSMTGSGEPRCFFCIHFSSKCVQPTYFFPYHKSNPMVFVGCSEPLSKVDDGVNDRDDIKTHVMVEDIKIVVSKHP